MADEQESKSRPAELSADEAFLQEQRLAQRQAAETFIRSQATLDDLDALERLIENRRRAMLPRFC
ncbi:hypothetical protein [Lacticaseibacillus mingshuiensis]|uniref:Uncharacterized protein n=1 Tax=Lacticaseibacillus mingshuiensis TaxID=2799574 RepID=A0ABW4CI62_9LACO|nr:hypothetical protein [Lacticaseibacillus mingshuiensis]